MVNHHYIKDSVIQILLAALFMLALGVTYAASAQWSNGRKIAWTFKTAK